MTNNIQKIQDGLRDTVGELSHDQYEGSLVCCALAWITTAGQVKTRVITPEDFNRLTLTALVGAMHTDMNNKINEAMKITHKNIDQPNNDKA